MTKNETTETSQPKKKRRKPSWVLPEDQWQFTKQLIADLGETEQKPRHMIARMVRFCGVEFAEHIFQQVMEIEESGGMLTAKGSRRRTPGGVFLHLAHNQMTSKQHNQVFGPHRKTKQKPAVEAENPEP